MNIIQIAEECKFTKFEANLFKEQLQAFADRLLAEQWISVKDRLPNTDMNVSGFTALLVVNDGHVQWALFNKKIKGFQDASYREITKQVTDWQYLPAPPIRKGDE